MGVHSPSLGEGLRQGDFNELLKDNSERDPERFCILGGICRFILSNFGFKYASILGFPYDTVMSVSSASFVTTSILFVTYIISGNSLRLVRSSLFEVLFNGCCCFNFMSACSWLLLIVHTFLYPDFLTTPFFVVYPLLIMVNILGFLLGIFYGVDSYLAYKYVSRC